MAQSKGEGTHLSQGVRRTLIIMVLFILAMVGFFIFFSHLPSSGETNEMVTPTAILTNAVGSISVNHTTDFNGLHLTVMQVEEAASFSDDMKPGGAFTVRVHVQTVNNGQNAIGTDYPALTRLILPDGQVVAPKYTAILPVALPGETDTGFLDFPIQSRLQLQQLSLRLGSTTTIAFGG